MNSSTTIDKPIFPLIHDATGRHAVGIERFMRAHGENFTKSIHLFNPAEDTWRCVHAISDDWDYRSMLAGIPRFELQFDGGSTGRFQGSELLYLEADVFMAMERAERDDLIEELFALLGEFASAAQNVGRQALWGRDARILGVRDGTSYATDNEDWERLTEKARELGRRAADLGLTDMIPFALH